MYHNYNDYNEMRPDSYQKEPKPNMHEPHMPFEPYIKVDTLARAYVPMQHMCEIYGERESLIKGTIFPELCKPYIWRENRYKKGMQYGASDHINGGGYMS